MWAPETLTLVLLPLLSHLPSMWPKFLTSALYLISMIYALLAPGLMETLVLLSKTLTCHLEFFPDFLTLTMGGKKLNWLFLKKSKIPKFSNLRGGSDRVLWHWSFKSQCVTFCMHGCMEGEIELLNSCSDGDLKGISVGPTSSTTTVLF